MSNYHSQAGKKAWEQSIGPSHNKMRAELIKKYQCAEEDIVHDVGYPDYMIKTSNNELHFYELKPIKAAAKRKFLSIQQELTINLLLSSGKVNVWLVYYDRNGGKIILQDPIQLSLNNLKKYSYSGQQDIQLQNVKTVAQSSCPICGEPRTHNKNGKLNKTCGKYTCMGKVAWRDNPDSFT